jgi:hypothetical protein
MKLQQADVHCTSMELLVEPVRTGLAIARRVTGQFRGGLFLCAQMLECPR